MTVSALPFTMALMAAYLKQGQGGDPPPYLTLAICAAVAVFYASPAASSPDAPISGAPLT